MTTHVQQRRQQQKKPTQPKVKVTPQRPGINPTASTVLRLQREIGNQATMRLLKQNGMMIQRKGESLDLRGRKADTAVTRSGEYTSAREKRNLIRRIKMAIQYARNWIGPAADKMEAYAKTYETGVQANNVPQHYGTGSATIATQIDKHYHFNRGAGKGPSLYKQLFYGGSSAKRNAEVYNRVAEVLRKTEQGLSQPQPFVDVRKSLRKKAVGYIRPPILFRSAGRIHVSFNLLKLGTDEYAAARKAAVVIVHEATHKYAGTDDHAYITAGSFAKLTRKKSANNADSHAFFAARLAGQYTGPDF